ncbi:MAG TPA: TIM barrel protein [Abditibacteriaceae bacterium]|nr:TIM barrel protein [Abditibacteriaceae bacterium]
MSSFKQSVSHWPLAQVVRSAEDYRKILEIGITGVEMPPRDKYDELRAAGFVIATVAGHAALGNGLNKKENHNRITDELRASLEVAQQYEIPNLICFSGNREGMDEASGAANTAEGLRLVAADAEAAGVNLIVELLNSKVDHADYQCDRTAWGVRVVEAVGSPRVKLLYDIYHMQIMEGDLIRTIRDNIQHIAHFHTAGNPGRNDLDEQQEIYYPAVARAIHETGYSGWVGHEFSPKGDVFASLQQAYAACHVA